MRGSVGVNKTLMKGPGFVAGLKGAARNETWSSLPLNRPRLSRKVRRAMRRGRSSSLKFASDARDPWNCTRLSDIRVRSSHVRAQVRRIGE